MAGILQIKQSMHEMRVPVTVFELDGEMDGSTFDHFQKEAQMAIDAGVQYVLLDLSRLGYISSAGLRALFTILKALSAKSGTSTGKNGNAGVFKSPCLKLFNPSPNVRQALELMGFTMSMEIHSDLNEALASF